MPLYNNGIGPGAARVVHYRVTRPATDAKDAIDAHRRRPLPQVLPRLHDLLPRRGISVSPRDDARLATPSHSPSPGPGHGTRDADRAPGRSDPAAGPRGNPDKPWLRWNDYGIGLFLQGTCAARARPGRAWPMLAPDKPDGPLNRARAEIAEGRLADAKRVARGGRAAGGRPGEDGVLPLDRRQGRGAVGRRRAGSEIRPREVPARPRRLEQPRVRSSGSPAGYPQAIEAYEKTLAIDSEDLNAHYNLMRVYRAHGRPLEGRHPRGGIPQYKDDETARAPVGGLPRATTRGTTASRCRSTSTPRPQPPPRPRLRWVASIGPKGYQTDMGYLTRAHPPIIREARDEQHPSKPAVARPAAGEAYSGP